jgi:hypothetical protein
MNLFYTNKAEGMSNSCAPFKVFGNPISHAKIEKNQVQGFIYGL